jgi:arylesterase / paraoxonase
MTPIRQALAKSATTLLVVGIVPLLFFSLRWFIMAGAFTLARSPSPGLCRPIRGIQGPEDFEVDAGHDTIIVSSTNRRAPKAHPDPRDGLYAIKLSDPTAPAVKLDGAPKDFHPHGISLYQGAKGEELLFVINHRQGGGQAVEVFNLTYDAGAPKLSPRSSVGGGLLISPNDLAAIAPDRFYVTNDHVTKNAWGRFAEDYLLWPHADLVYFNGTSFRISVQQMAFPNGVFVSPDQNHVYVTLSNSRRLIAFSREPFFGSLTEIGSLSLPARPDNISADAKGNLIIAARPNLMRDSQFRADPTKPSPSEIFRVHLDKSGVPQSYDTLFADDGSRIGGASTAAVTGNMLVIGSALDNKLLECTIQ